MQQDILGPTPSEGAKAWAQGRSQVLEARCVAIRMLPQQSIPAGTDKEANYGVTSQGHCQTDCSLFLA